MDREIKVLIVDDDASARNIIKKYLEIGDKVEIVGTANDTVCAMKIYQKTSPDLIFLDINMPDENGLQFATKLRETDSNVQIVFTTAYKHYAIQAIHLKPLDYLVKPFGLDEVFDILTKAEKSIDEKLNRGEQQKIWGNVIPDKLKFKTIKGFIFLKPSDIFYAQVMGPIVELIMCDGSKERIITLFNLLCNELINFDFAKINRSLLINMRYFTHLDRKEKMCTLKLNDKNHRFAVSQTFIKEFEKQHSMKIG
jgi:DNA-binding LytR/AlgR family response regulator